MPSESIECLRCGRTAAPLTSPPFPNDVGQRIHEGICTDCWAKWLEHQTALINHYGLDVRDPKAREFLYGKIEEILLKGEPEEEEIDTSRKGEIEW